MCAPELLLFQGLSGVALSFQKWGSAGGGALSCTSPGIETVVQTGVGSGAGSIPGRAGLCWRGWELSRLTHPPAPITAAGLVPLGCVPVLFQANNTREEAACCRPEPTAGSGAFLSILLRPPASLLRGLCVPRAAAASSCAVLAPVPLCQHSPAYQVLCPASLLGADAKTSIVSTSVPSGISSVPFAYFSS